MTGWGGAVYRSKSAAERAYESEFGTEALERQKRLAKDYFTCCGRFKDDGHHEACSKRPDEPDLPALIEGQETLA